MFSMENIDRKISGLRKGKNMTQMELADKMSISFQAVPNWERGNSMPDIAKLPELAQIFEVTIDELSCGAILKIKQLIEKPIAFLSSYYFI